MESSCVRQTLIPGTSKLFGDYLYDFDRVGGFFPTHFCDGEALVHAAQQLNYPDSRRSQLVAALRLQNGDSPSLAKLAQPGTVAVVTGQQVGLFSGPAYTVFKALTAVKLADYLNQQGTPAVPIFWLATEDHDLAEADHAWVFDHEASPAKIAVTGGISGGGPVGNVELPQIPISELRQAMRGLEFADVIVDRVAAAYHAGATFGAAFRAFLEDILKPFGLLYLDPLAPEIRAIAAPLMQQATAGVQDLTSSLRERDRDLKAAGYHSQVLVDKDTSLLFLLGQGKRTPIRWREGRFVTKDRAYTAADLQAFPERLSPNALLRPVMQDFLLPTVSYIGGPAEVAYMAQSSVLYEKLLGRMPVIFPRNSFTLLDARATKIMDRQRLHVADVLDSHEQLKGRIAAQLVPADLRDEIACLRDSMSSGLAKLEGKLNGFDSTLEAASKKSSAKILYQLDKLARKTARETMRRDRHATQDANYLINLVYPHRHLQERFYSIVPFLAKYGPDLPERLLAATQLACPDHMVRTV